MEVVIGSSLMFLGVFLVFLPISYYLRSLIWKVSPLFFLINWIMWVAYNPLRFIWKNTESNFAYRSSFFLAITLITPFYWFFIHALLTPLRIINAIYFDVFLYWSVMIRDNLEELFKPKLGSYQEQTGKTYLFHWLYALPYRFIRFILSSLFTISDSFLMVGVSIVFPTLTMYHGTKFQGALTNIAQKGEWKVGKGNFVGSGVYFGITKKVASHYADKHDKGIIVARITPTFTKTASTLSPKLRNYIGGFGADGDKLSQKMPFLFYTIEHWRNDFGGWWEYCITQSQGVGATIKTWRIRPVILLREGEKGYNEPHRLWGGMYHYTLGFSSLFMGLLSWFILLAIVTDASS